MPPSLPIQFLVTTGSVWYLYHKYWASTDTLLLTKVHFSCYRLCALDTWTMAGTNHYSYTAPFHSSDNLRLYTLASLPTLISTELTVYRSAPCRNCPVCSFSCWLLSPSNMHLRGLHVFRWLTATYFFYYWMAVHCMDYYHLTLIFHD